MGKLSQAFISARQLSIQEAMYLCLPKLWLRKFFPRVNFINTSLFNLSLCQLLKNDICCESLQELNIVKTVK